MDAAVRHPPTKMPAFDLLLRHCLSLGGGVSTRPPARVRLEAAIGPELARRLVASLVAPRRRY